MCARRQYYIISELYYFCPFLRLDHERFTFINIGMDDAVVFSWYSFAPTIQYIKPSKLCLFNIWNLLQLSSLEKSWFDCIYVHVGINWKQDKKWNAIPVRNLMSRAHVYKSRLKNTRTRERTYTHTYAMLLFTPKETSADIGSTITPFDRASYHLPYFPKSQNHWLCFPQ